MSDSHSDTVSHNIDSEFPKRIYHADDEREVTAAIDEYGGHLMWHKLGDTTRNYSVVYNQASDPVGALGELVANSIDATLMRRYFEQYGREYDPKHGLNSYEDAKQLLNGDEEIEIVADGPKPKSFNKAEKPYGYPNIAVLDRGHGQPANRFEETLVGFFLPGEQKDEFPFVQGRFGMGGSAVLPHSGDRMYKFIASASMDQPGEWTWTLVRDTPDKSQKFFEYLKIGKDLPTFTGEFESRQVGTIVRVYDYNFTSNIRRTPGHMSSRFIELMDREMVRSPIKIRGNERRTGYQNPASATTKGILDKLERDRYDLVKRDFVKHHNFGSKIGRRPVRIIVLKSDRELEENGVDKKKKTKYVSSTLQKEQALFFTRNEQTHGDLGVTFLKNKCNKPRVGKDTLVFCDFSTFEPLEDLFKPSRDRLTDKSIVMSLKENLIDLIKNNDWMSREEERRRNELQTEEREEQRSEIVENIAEENETFARFLEEGEMAEVKSQDGNDSDEQPLCPLNRFPKRFEIITWQHGDEFETWTSGETYRQKHPVNKRQFVRFLLDAEDRYFVRSDRPGRLSLTADDGVVKSWGLENGILHVTFAEPDDDIEPGDSRDITFTVERHNRTPLQESLTIKYENPVDYERNPPGSRNESESRELPEFDRVTEDGRNGTISWEDISGDMDETVPVIALFDGSLYLYINHDMNPIRNYISRKNLTESDKDYVANVWDAGIQLYATATYYRLKQSYNDVDVDVSQLVADSMAGVTMTMLDQHIDDEELTGAN